MILIEDTPDGGVSVDYTLQNEKTACYLWLVIDPNVKTVDVEMTRSLVLAATSENEVKQFLEHVMKVTDAVSSKSRIDSLPEWPEKTLVWSRWMSGFKSDINELKIINIGTANSEISKGVLVVDNTSS